MEISEIINRICGDYVNDEAKAMTGCTLFGGRDESDTKEIDTIATSRPAIFIQAVNGLIQLDIDFMTDKSAEMAKMWDLIQKKNKLETEEMLKDTDDAMHYLILFNFLSTDNITTAYIDATNPMLSCLTARNVESPISTIRMLFDPEDVGFYDSNDMDFKEEDMEIDMELRRRESMDSQYEEKMIRQQEQIARYDELRKKYKDY